MIAKLSMENYVLSRAKIDLEKIIDSMKIKIDDLTKKNVNLQNSFSKFYLEQQKLETQKAFFDIDGLGYNGSVKETHFKNFFAKTNDSHETSSKCAYCKKLGHSIQFCPLKIVTFKGKIIKSV